MTQQQLFEKRLELNNDQIEFFKQHELFTWQWWLLIGLTILPWCFWFFFRDKKVKKNLLLGGIFVALLSVLGDTLGVQFGGWMYGIKAIPSIPPLIPFDLTVMPVEFIIIQQISKRSKQLLWNVCGVSLINSFVAGPILKWINIYYPNHWHYIYSFPIYFIIFWLASKIVKTNNK